MQVVVNSLLTVYARAGKGRTIVLVHGWGDSSASFRGLESKLTEHFDVINIDLPGFGQTQVPPEVWGLDDYATFIRDFLNKIGVNYVHAYVGHSNGGALLIRGLAEGTLRADRLILLASAGIRAKGGVKKKVIKAVTKVGKAATILLPNRYKRAIRKKLYGVVGSDMLVVPALQETFKKTVSQDVQEDAKKLQIPVLLIYGSKDPATPLADGQLLSQIMPKATLETVHGVGHYVHQEAPEVVLAYMETFLT